MASKQQYQTQCFVSGLTSSDESITTFYNIGRRAKLTKIELKNSSLSGNQKFSIKEIFTKRHNQIAIIDTSVVRYEKIVDYLRKNFNQVVVTTIVADELDWLKGNKAEPNSKTAQQLLKEIATDNSQFFICQMAGIPFNEKGIKDSDLGIINYCKTVKSKNFVLLTADAGMAVRAKGRDLPVRFLDNIDLSKLPKISLDGIVSESDKKIHVFKSDSFEIIVKNVEGKFLKDISKPYLPSIGDELFMIRRETLGKEKVFVFKHIKVLEQDKGGILKKIIVRKNQRIELYNYTDEEKSKLEKFANSFIESSK